MTKLERVTITMDAELIKAARKIQAQKIQTESRAVSFSEVIGELVQKGLKHK